MSPVGPAWLPRAGAGLTLRMVIATGLLGMVVAGAFAVLLWAISDVRTASNLSRHSQQVLAASNRLERLVIDVETGQRGFLLTDDARFLQPWEAARASIPAASRDLDRLTIVAVQDARAHRITAAIAAYVTDYSVPLVNGARRGDPSVRSVATTAEGKRLVDDIRADFDRLVAKEDQLATTRQDHSATAARRAVIAAAAGVAGSVLLIAVFARYLTGAIVRPVRRASSMARQFAGGDLAVRMPETGIAEIGVLERSFNTMGNALEESREALRLRAEEQAALRRIATLVARGVPPGDVFRAMTAEAGALFGAASTRLIRYEADGTATVITDWSAPGAEVPVGTCLALDGDSVVERVLRTARPARMDDFEAADGSIAELMRRLGLRSAVGAPAIVEGRLWGALIVGWTEEAGMATDTVERMTEFMELVATAIANADSRAELTASRARVVAASDEARRRIERDLHDGAQQRLVSLGLELRAAAATVPPERDELTARLSETAKGLADVIQDLQEMSRGIHPAILSRGGLGPAVRALARRSAIPVELAAIDDRRLPERVEVAAYYVVSEALTNATKHAKASIVRITLDAGGGIARLSIGDDGVGGADPRGGTGLVGLRDRVEALGGTIEVESPPGGGTSVRVRMPIDGT